MTRICVYTAICGGYDRLKAQPQQTVECDWICFSDTPIAPVGQWHVVPVAFAPGNTTSTRLRAKYFKIQSHQLFPGGWLDAGSQSFGTNHYDYLIWIDASVQLVRADFVEMMIANIGTSGWAMFKHPWRNCIYDEALESAPMLKYQGQQIIEQADAYKRAGFPANQGLWCGGLIARKTDAHHLAAINELWWRENLRWSYQDQISLPIVLWRLGLSVDTVNVPFHNDYYGFDVAHRMHEWGKVAA